VRAGVAKFNVGTILKKTWFEALRATVADQPERPDVHALLGSHKPADLLAPAAAALRAVVRERIRVYGGSGRA